MTRQHKPKHEPTADKLEAEITPLTPEEEEEYANLLEKPNYRFGGGLYVNGIDIPDTEGDEDEES